MTGKEKINPKKTVGMRETSLDNPKTYLPMIKDAMKTVENLTSETADGSGVWNGRTKALEMALEEAEGKWERRSLEVDARYGHNYGSYLLKMDEKGAPEMYVPLEMPADFWWRQVIAFEHVSQDGEAPGAGDVEQVAVGRHGRRAEARMDDGRAAHARGRPPRYRRGVALDHEVELARDAVQQRVAHRAAHDVHAGLVGQRPEHDLRTGGLLKPRQDVHALMFHHRARLPSPTHVAAQEGADRRRRNPCPTRRLD